MKRMIVVGIVLLGVLPQSASCAVIGMWGDEAASWCLMMVPVGMQKTGYILCLPQEYGALTGAEFRVVGFPDGLYITQATPSPAANILIGDPLDLGCNLAFPTCQQGNLVTLFSVLVFNLADTEGNRVIEVQQHSTPSNPNFACPLITLCDAPAYTKQCVYGGQMYLNHYLNCEVAVQQKNWSAVKGLFR